MHCARVARCFLWAVLAAVVAAADLAAAPFVAVDGSTDRGTGANSGTAATDDLPGTRNSLDKDGLLWSASPDPREVRIDAAAPARRARIDPGFDLPPGATSPAVGGIEPPQGQRNSYLLNLMRDFTGDGTDVAEPLTLGSMGMGRSGAQGGAQWEALDGVLKMVRNSLLEDGDSANFTLAGVEIGLTLRGSRRSFTVNGYELLSTNAAARAGDEWQMTPANYVNVNAATDAPPVSVAVGQSGAGIPLDANQIVSKIREFATEPLSIALMMVAAALWVFAHVLRSARSRQGW